jgi:hypothetical protein
MVMMAGGVEMVGAGQLGQMLLHGQPKIQTAGETSSTNVIVGGHLLGNTVAEILGECLLPGFGRIRLQVGGLGSSRLRQLQGLLRIDLLITC